MRISRKLPLAIFVLFILGLVSPSAHATTATGTVTVTATTVASVSLTFVTDGAGITLVNSGTAAATINFGSVQAYGGSVPAGVTKQINGTTSWSLSTPIDVVVQVANQTSSDYTLTAALQTSDGTNVWQFGSTSLTTSAATLTSSGSYGSTAFTFTLTIPFSETAGSISNTVNFTATAN
jgi:hypothetical protein